MAITASASSITTSGPKVVMNFRRSMANLKRLEEAYQIPHHNPVGIGFASLLI
jgi:hypothetical protein